MEAAVITTYRCTNRCHMCNAWKYPTQREEEFCVDVLDKLPNLTFANITGGEPFLRDDIEDIVCVLKKKAKRIVISTNGFFTEKIIDVAKKHKNIGFRISIEGLPQINDELRGKKHCFDHGLRTLLELQQLRIKDIGFGITVSDRNATDMLELYQLAKAMNIEFATAVVHNSYYFHKYDNKIHKKDYVISCFVRLMNKLLESQRPKNWFRAYFNFGLVNYILGRPRLLNCDAGTDVFFLDPWGEIRPCNGMDSDSLENSFGNLCDKSFEDIWLSEKAESVRKQIRQCTKNCWMIGTAAPAMKKNIIQPLMWVITHKINSVIGKGVSLK